MLRKRRQARQQSQTPPLDFLEWTFRYRKFLGPDIPFDLDEHRYLEELYQTTAQRLAIKKASQMGLSEWAIGRALWSCDRRDANVFYVMPSYDDVYDFSQMRMGPAIEVSEYLAGLVVSSANAWSGKRGTDRVTMKRIRNRFIIFRGGGISNEGKARQLKSVPADLVIRDEVDEMDPRVAEIVRKRLTHSLLKEEIALSTPTYSGVGIDAEWLESDQRRWFIPCPSCGHRQYLTIEHVILDWNSIGQPIAWHGQYQGDAWPACQKCGNKLDRLAQGEWVPAYPGREISGYHLTNLFSARASVLDIVNGLQTTSETRRKEIYNQDLGETYATAGGTITDEELRTCTRDYLHGPRHDTVTFAGVDVGSVLHTIIRSRADSRGDRAQLFAGELRSFEELGPLLDRYNVKTCVIDALPETQKAREFQASRRAGQVWLAYYYAGADGTKKSDITQWDEPEGTVTVDRTRALDATYGLFYSEENTLPANAEDVRDLFEHMKASKRIVREGRNGQQVAFYINDKPDHYCFAAGTLIRTKAGDVPIEKVAKGMLVATRRGWRRVTAAWQTNPKAAVNDYIFSNGVRLRATPEHPVFVCGKGYVPLDAVTSDDTVETWSQNELSVLKQLSRLVHRTVPVHVAESRENDTKLIAVKPAGEEPVFNLEVEGAHEYYANQILVHNCHAENYAYVASLRAVARAAASSEPHVTPADRFGF